MPAPPPAAATTTASNTRAARAEEVYYPCSDGKPMAENMWQAKAIMNAAGDLGAALPTALVAADILMYPDEGNNKNPIAPDVLVALGLGTHNRSSYFVWVEGKPPDWVLEVASPSTQADDLGVKRRRYAAIGVPEYWMFDARSPQRGARGAPSHEEFSVYPPGTPRLQGLKLADGKYIPLPWQLADGVRTIHSEVLGLDVCVDGELLRFRDAATGRDVPHRSDVQAAAERAEAQAKREAAQRKAAEAKAEREAARADRQAAHARQEAVRAKQEAARAERQAARAIREASARASAEARVAQLEAALRRSRAGQRP